jgi:phosphate transport system substrate-binding protein
MQLRTMIVAALALVALLQCEGGKTLVTNYSEVSSEDRSAFSEPLAIVVNKSNPIDDLSFVELRRVFLGERSHWANGRRITLVMREPGEPERRTILRDVCGMNEDQFKTHLLGGLFTGDILVSPKILAAPSGVRKFVFNVPGAIGYLRLGDVDGSVKVVRIDKLLPEDRGYKLRIRSEAGN